MKQLKLLFMLVALLCASTTARALDRITWSVTGVTEGETLASGTVVYDINLSDGNGHTTSLTVYAGGSTGISEPTYDEDRHAAVLNVYSTGSLYVPDELIIPASEDAQYVSKQIYVWTSNTPSNTDYIEVADGSATYRGGKGYGTPTTEGYYFCPPKWPDDACKT